MSDDETPPNRPNAKYKLSNSEKKLGNETPVFYYNRERRLEKAPQAVKDFYAKGEKKPARFGLFSTLTADRPRAMLFITIVMLCVVIFTLSVLGKLDTYYSLEGNRLEISGTIYEDTTIIVLKKSIAKGNEAAYTGAVDIAVSPVEKDEELRVFYHRVFFSLEKNEEYRFAVPYDADELLLVINNGRTSVNVKFKPE